MSLGSFDKLTPLQETRCMLLDIKVEYLAPRGMWVIYRRHPTEISILAPIADPAYAQTYATPEEAIDDYVKNKDNYRWV